MNNKIKKLTFTSMITAIYFILCFVEQTFANGAIQCRLSEALTLLPLFFPEAIIGVTLGCLIFNISTGIIWDITIGTLCTFVSCIITYLVGRFIKKDIIKIILGGLSPVLINALIIPLVLMYGYKLTNGYIFLAISIFIGQFIAIYIIGGLMYFPLKKVLARFKVINSKEDIN